MNPLRGGATTSKRSFFLSSRLNASLLTLDSLMVAVRIMSGLRASCRYILVRASVCEMEKLRSFAQLLLDIGPHTTWLMNALKEFRKTVYLSGHFKADIFKKKIKEHF